MNCETTRMLLAFRRANGPAELTAADATELAAHLAGCPACAALARQHAAFDTAVAASMKAVPAPGGLRDRLLTSALARRGALQRLRLYKALTAAAALLVAATIGYGVSHQLRPTVNSTELAGRFERDYENPEEMVRRFLADHDLPADVPVDLDFRLAVTCGGQELGGRDAPFVELITWQPGQNRPDIARVFVLKESRFDLRSLQDAQSSFANVHVVRGRGLAYVIVFNSSLQPFLRTGARMAKA